MGISPTVPGGSEGCGRSDGSIAAAKVERLQCGEEVALEKR